MTGKTVRLIALVTVMAAVTCALTLVVLYSIPATGGYIHPGDIAANFAALAFGPWLGALIVGGGMALADVINGWASYAPATLVIHGLQAVIVGLLSRRSKPWTMFLAAIAGGAVVVAGYFCYQVWIVGTTVLAASQEVPWNILQVGLGLVGVPVYILVTRAYPPLVRWLQRD